jgi:putative phosphoribosyl transferase
MGRPMRLLKDRHEAGRMLAEELGRYAGKAGVVALGLPRGGVVVAFEVARVLGVPLDVFLVRKLGVPGHEELAAGALASGGLVVLNEDVVRSTGMRQSQLDQITAREQALLERREQLYRGHSDRPDLVNKQVLLIDDGLATGASMRTAVAALRRLGPARITVAVPVGPADTCDMLAREVDEVVCPMTPWPFFSIGEWYEDFSQTPDEEVVELLDKAKMFASSARRAE